MRWLALFLAVASHAAECGSLAEMRADWERLLADELDPSAVADYPFGDCFLAAAERYRLPVQLLLGLAWGESAFDPEARSPKNAIGVMQIRWPGTARDLGFDSIGELHDACRNIRAGARYLRWLLDRVDGDAVLALASYNHGPGAIDGSEGNVGAHARGYVCYIRDKTLAVLDGDRPGATATWLRLGRFTDYGMARRTRDSYRRRVRLRDGVDLTLDIQHVPGEGYELRVACESRERRDEERGRYERITGFDPH